MLRATFTLVCKFQTTLRSQSSQVVVLMLPCFNLILISFILFYNKRMFLHKYKTDFFFSFCLGEVHVVSLLQSLYFVSVVSSNVERSTGSYKQDCFLPKMKYICIFDNGKRLASIFPFVVLIDR